MENKTNETNRFHEIIETKHVFIEDNQVFMKMDALESVLQDNLIEVWHPINFQWIPVIALKESLIHQPTPLQSEV